MARKIIKMRPEVVERLYSASQGTIRDLVAKFAGSNDHLRDELIGEADVLFMKAVTRYTGRCKFNTFLCVLLRNGFAHFMSKYEPPYFDTREAGGPAPGGDPSDSCGFRDLVRSLSDEAREVMQILIDGPAEALQIIGTEPPKMIRGAITRFLRRRGANRFLAGAVMHELQVAANGR